MTEPLILTYRNGQWTDQHGRKVVNPKVADDHIIEPSGNYIIMPFSFEWPGTYEVVTTADGMNSTAILNNAPLVKLIAPISGSDVTDDVPDDISIKPKYTGKYKLKVTGMNSAHGFTEGADVPAAGEGKTDEWIDRNVRMPAPHVQVLVSIKYGAGNRSFVLSYCTERFPDVFDHFSDGVMTHWMPLPKPPQP